MEQERTSESILPWTYLEAGATQLRPALDYQCKGELNHIPLFHNHSITSLILSFLKVNLLHSHLPQKSQPM